MAYADFDTTEFPLARVKFTGEKSTDQNFQEYLHQLEALYLRREVFAIVFDATEAAIPNLRHQKMQAYWLRNNSELVETYCRGTAYIILKSTTRAILKLIFAINPQPVPYKVVVTEADARKWALSQLGV